MEKIKKELDEIAEKYKKDFKTEINSERVFETKLDIFELINEYKIRLKKELQDVASGQLQYINKSEENKLNEFIRSLLIDFLTFAQHFLDKLQE